MIEGGAEAILPVFARIAFDNELGGASPILNRWEGPLRYRVTGPATASQRAIVDGQMTALRALTGLAIEAGEPVNFTIHTGPRPTEAQIRVEFSAIGGGTLRALGRARCFFVYRAESGPIIGAVAYIPAALDDEAFRHCVVEETTQALGLPNDRGPAGSVFNDDSDTTALTPIDRLMLRLLYAPELRAGMPRGEATAAARIALDRLLAR